MALKVCQLTAVDFTLRKFLLPLIDAMNAAGWEVTAVCSDGPYIAGLQSSGYRVCTLPIARSLNLLAHVRSIIALVRHFRAEQYDVLHAHTPVAALIGRLAARVAGIPLIVYTAHGFYFHDEMPAWKRRIFILLEQLGGRYTDFLFTQSEEDAVAAVHHEIMPAEKLLVIGNGVDAARFDPVRISGDGVRREAGIPLTAPVVGIIGRLVREKGYVEFLEAAERVGERFSSAHFIVIGERLPSDHNATIDEHIARAAKRLGPRLVMTGMRDDVERWLAAMDVFCLPSYREGMPRTIIEAMMMGKPVVATNIRGAREEVVNGVTGVLVPTRNVDALVAALSALLEDPAAGARMGAAGRDRARRLYDERTVIERQMDVLRLLSERRDVVRHANVS